MRGKTFFLVSHWEWLSFVKKKSKRPLVRLQALLRCHRGPQRPHPLRQWDEARLVNEERENWAMHRTGRGNKAAAQKGGKRFPLPLCFRLLENKMRRGCFHFFFFFLQSWGCAFHVRGVLSLLTHRLAVQLKCMWKAQQQQYYFVVVFFFFFLSKNETVNGGRLWEWFEGSKES